MIIAAGGVTTISTLRNNMKSLKVELSASKRETKEDIAGIQAEIRKLSEVVTRQAAADTRINGIDQRMTSLEKDIRELRHGAGFVRGPLGVDREYP
jgi:ABC-type hemin transport system substrate-binding protein